MAMRDDELNTLIDDVARHMTAGDPGAAFTSRVLARLESDERPARSWRPVRSWRPAFAGLSAAVALLVMAVVMYRGNSPNARAVPTVRLTPGTTSPDRGPERPAQQAGATAAAADVPLERLASPPTVVAQTAPATRSVTRRASLPSGLAHDIAPIETSSIVVAPLDSVPLDPVDSIRAAPLGAPMSITLAPLEGGDDIPRRFE